MLKAGSRQLHTQTTRICAAGTSAVLQRAVELPAGIYDIPLMVRDQQGLGQEQTVTIRICRCAYGECLPPRRWASLDWWAILAMLLALVVLVLLCKLRSLLRGIHWKNEIKRGAPGVGTEKPRWQRHSCGTNAQSIQVRPIGTC